jgi:hypothetical protein
MKILMKLLSAVNNMFWYTIFAVVLSLLFCGVFLYDIMMGRKHGKN